MARATEILSREMREVEVRDVCLTMSEDEATMLRVLLGSMTSGQAREIIGKDRCDSDESLNRAFKHDGLYEIYNAIAEAQGNY